MTFSVWLSNSDHRFRFIPVNYVMCDITPIYHMSINMAKFGNIRETFVVEI